MKEQLSDTILKGDTGDFFGPHEIHVTTDPERTDPEQFRRACGQIGVKAHVIYNETPQGITTVDYLTGSDYECSSFDAFVELERIAEGLQTSGLEVVRKKIETIPNHPLAPTSPSDKQQPYNYFESHFTLPDLPTTHGWKLLQWQGQPFLISTTDSKRSQGLLFATMRHYETTAGNFCSTINDLHTALSAQLEDVKNPTVEFALYDSNPAHDKEWVESYKLG